MITLLSPTKTQSDLPKISLLPQTTPHEINKANFLISLVSKLTENELSTLMGVSAPLALKTKNAFKKAFERNANKINSIFLFQGDAFQKLDANSLDNDALLFSQEHLVILSALYGYLKPLDIISNYRLDMKDSLIIPGYKNLYHYWKEEVTSGINALLSTQKDKILLNLASTEYFNMLDLNKLKAKVINVEFKVNKDNTLKTIGVYAKRGRGSLARYIIDNKIDSLKEIIHFNRDGFQYSTSESKTDHYVFILKC